MFVQNIDVNVYTFLFSKGIKGLIEWTFMTYYCFPWHHLQHNTIDDNINLNIY